MRKNDGVWVHLTNEEFIKYFRWLNGESTKEVNITHSVTVDMNYIDTKTTDELHIDWVEITN